MLIGVAALVGWALEARALKSITPGLPAMKANTAFALVLGGLALVVLRGQPRGERRHVGRACALGVAAIGVLTILEYLFGNLGIDTVLWHDVGRSAGRSSLHTAIALALLGAALLAGTQERPSREFDVLVALLGLVVLAALIGYAYGVDYLRGVSGATGMAIHTALALTALWAGVAWLREDRGIPALVASERSSAVMLRRLAPLAVLGPFVLGVLRLEGQREGLYDQSVGVAVLTLAVIVLITALLASTARVLDVAEARRAETERRFETLVESAPEAMVIVNADGEIVLVNAQMERLFGYVREDLVGSAIDLLVPEPAREAHRAHRAAFLARPSVRQMSAQRELSALCADGRMVPVEVSLAPLPQTGGAPLVCAAIRDVSEQRRAEETRRRLAAIVEHTDDAILAEAPDGQITEWNAGAERLYGYSADEVIGRPSSILVPAERAGAEVEIRRRVIDGNEVEHDETIHLHKDGARVNVALTVSPIRDANGVVVGASTIARDIRDRKRIEGQLQFLADHDPLTGLFNRRRFEQELQHEMDRVRRFGRSSAILAIDLDHFKFVNDSFGHAAGDALIRRASVLFRSRLRDTDVLARIGGDEFAAILPEVDGQRARRVADGLLQVLREDTESITASGGRMTASIGIACFGVSDELTGEELLVEADIAMYDAKDAGRDRAAHYDSAEDRHRRMHAHLAWAERIRRALDEDRFIFHAQPMLPLADRQPVAYELLLRMIDEHGEIVGPGAFLPIAERLDLIEQIDRRALRKGVGTLAAAQAAGHDIRLSINLSGRSLNDASLAEFLAAELAAAGAEASGLWLEVTETAAIANIDAARRFASEAQQLGCGIALDDFGAGFASFYYLKHLPFDHLKIDGEFVEQLPRSPTNRLIVQSIVDIAKGLGKQTVAEFVGDADTLDLVRELGVDYAQGFHVSPPRPIDELRLTTATSS